MFAFSVPGRGWPPEARIHFPENMATHHNQEPTSLEELADYIGELLALVNGPMLHLVVPATAERELFIERVVERLGGGVVFTPNRRSTP